MKKNNYLWLLGFLVAVALGTSCAKQVSKNQLVESIYNSESCDFAYHFTNNIRQYITEEEWQNIRKGRFTKKRTEVNPVYSSVGGVYIDWLTYKSNGIEVVYLYQNKEPVIWQVYFEAHRMPESMRSKKYFTSVFNIKDSDMSGTPFLVGCEGWELKLYFENEITKHLSIISTSE